LDNSGIVHDGELQRTIPESCWAKRLKALPAAPTADQ